MSPFFHNTGQRSNKKLKLFRFSLAVLRNAFAIPFVSSASPDVFVSFDKLLGARWKFSHFALFACMHIKSSFRRTLSPLLRADMEKFARLKSTHRAQTHNQSPWSEAGEGSEERGRETDDDSSKSLEHAPYISLPKSNSTAQLWKLFKTLILSKAKAGESFYVTFYWMLFGCRSLRGRSRRRKTRSKRRRGKDKEDLVAHVDERRMSRNWISNLFPSSTWKSSPSPVA